MPDWMEPFARTIDAAKKYVLSSTVNRVDWNAEIASGDQLGKAVQQLKRFRLNSRSPSGPEPLPGCAVGSTGERNTLVFSQRWSVGDEAAKSDLLFCSSAVRDLGSVAGWRVDEVDRATV